MLAYPASLPGRSRIRDTASTSVRCHRMVRELQVPIVAKLRGSHFFFGASAGLANVMPPGALT